MLYYKKPDGDEIIFDNQEIFIISIMKGKYIFHRIQNGTIVESYAPVNKERASINAVSIIQGFQPPRSLLHLDKLSG